MVLVCISIGFMLFLVLSVPTLTRATLRNRLKKKRKTLKYLFLYFKGNAAIVMKKDSSPPCVLSRVYVVKNSTVGEE
jgi:hypothetical protein